MSIVALAGGVGAARLLRGLVRTVPPTDVTIVVNTGDDRDFYGVHVSPDVDIVSYTLAGIVNEERGYGIEGDGFRVVDALGELGHETWFRLGDRDFAHCHHRTLRLRQGAGLAEVTDELRRGLRIEAKILPMSEDPCPAFVELTGDRRVHFEEYLARDGAPDNVTGVDLSAAQAARPAPGVLAALAGAEAIVLCPSNPVVSIGPILAVPGIRDALRQTPAPVVAISPLIGGLPVKGPAAQLLRGTGAEVSASSVASLCRDFASGFVLDSRDTDQIPAVEALGLRTRHLDTLMTDIARSTAVAEAAVSLARELA